MTYALWIALAVVLVAIGPALIRSLRGGGKRSSGDDRDDGGADGKDGGGGGGD